ncbi:MFS transporter [Rhodanobacter sp. PCA2]|uniref:AmpG family muropeptide MFS transporter n=1 Tax=Rhodanobacter sp. PCA2 TaxID=2006117 RepID=UPI0015E7D998|nr:MFS transporter [Rhodanobacter sp. PCA2]MBA2080015.1 MFS transporter [Rhodanobacter sp. PCA2]
MPTEGAAVAPGRSWRILSIGLLGFASGLPLALSGSALQAWFTTAGMSLRDIGWITLIGQAYVFKFLWAPLLDRLPLPFMGRRRGWIFMMQLLCGVALISMSFYTPQGGAATLAFLGVLLAFASATQDTAYDAHRTDLLPPAERGWGTASAQGGYRAAMLVSGALSLILADHMGWAWVYRLMGALMLAAMAVTATSPEAPDERPARNFAEAVIEPFADFFHRYGMLALAWLALMVLYKLSDAFALSLSTTFLLRVPQFTLTQLGAINKTFGLAAGLLGALAGGWVVTRMRLFPALLLLGVLQALVNLGYIWLVHSGPDLLALAAVVGAENFFSGLGSTAFVVLVTALCNVRYSATQYALLSSLAAVGRVFLGPLAAWLVPKVGWSDFFVITVLSALPGLLLIFALRRAIDRAELARPH